MAQKNSILEISNVDQCFRSGFWLKQVQVLHGVALSIPRKSIFGFLGPNGAGKTTLINLIVGIRKPTRGNLRLNGYDCHSLEARSQIGYLPERPYFHDHLTAEGMLQYFGSLSGMKSSEIKSRIPVVLEIVNMSHARKLELKKYSKGMLQRIGIAQALLHDPDFLVLDEPMSGLDPVGRKEIRELIIRLGSEGKTIFFSSHVIPDVEAICDQVGMIQKGRIVGCGPIQHFLAQKVENVEVGFSGISVEDAKKISEFTTIREIPEGIRAMVTGKEINSVLEKLISKRAEVKWVNPIRPSLESFFGVERT
jgi:ABC-2 type transport system ATP-binding protein